MSELLAQFLDAPQRPDGTLKLPEVQGLLFAITCSPELIRPSEWMPLIFNEGDAGYADMEEAEAVLEALMTLYNEINEQVLEGEVALPDDIRFELPALKNVGEEAALGQWARGFSLGHDWLIDLWDHYTPDELDEELGSSLMVLSFFSSRELVEAFYHEVAEAGDSSLEDFAEKVLSLIEDAMNSYTHLAHNIQTVLAKREQPSQPFVGGDKVGRNDPCPCGSGKKYKKCCLQ